VSTPGTKYEVSGVDFKPSLEETQEVKAKVRERLYNQINEEIARMNKAYPTQNYTVSNLIFVEGGDGVAAQPRAYQAKEMNVLAVSAPPVGAPLTVSNELILTALVEAASNRNETPGKSLPTAGKPAAENLNSAKVASKSAIKPAETAINSIHAVAKLNTKSVILSPVKAASNLIGSASNNRIPGH